MGDFNETLWQFKHFPERQRGEKQMEAFREFWLSVICMTLVAGVCRGRSMIMASMGGEM
jgi:hypothetical protein